METLFANPLIKNDVSISGTDQIKGQDISSYVSANDRKVLKLKALVVLHSILF